MTSIAEKFQSPDYIRFSDVAKRSSADASMKILDNKLVYGNTKVGVPSFRNIDEVKAEIQSTKLNLLLKVNDLYDKIVVADEPIIYKAKYNSIVGQIQQIEQLLDEIDSYVSTVNEQKVWLPISNLLTKIDNNKMSASQVISNSQDDVYTTKRNVSKLVSLHKEGVKLATELADAKDVNELDYIIWERKTEIDNKSLAPVNKERTRATSSTGKRLSIAKKAVIKKATKKVMLQKLT